MSEYSTPHEDPVEELFAAELPEVLRTTGWSVTIGDDLQHCNQEVMREGEFVCLSPIDKGRTEQAVIATRHSLPGVLVDWHWMRNKAVVRCLRGSPEKVKSVFLEHCRQEMLQRILNNDAMERRAESEGMPFNPRWERSQAHKLAA